jgi:hypothetical protein
VAVESAAARASISLMIGDSLPHFAELLREWQLSRLYPVLDGHVGQEDNALFIYRQIHADLRSIQTVSRLLRLCCTHSRPFSRWPRSKAWARPLGATVGANANLGSYGNFDSFTSGYVTWHEPERISESQSAEVISLSKMQANDQANHLPAGTWHHVPQDVRSLDVPPFCPRPVTANRISEPGADSVIDLFSRITGVPPTARALMMLRLFFRCTGPVTRSQRRNREEMKIAFENHRTVILTAMQNPAVVNEVAKILVSGNKHTQVKQDMMISAYSFFGVYPSRGH